MKVEIIVLRAMWYAYWLGCQDAHEENPGGSFFEAIDNYLALLEEENAVAVREEEDG